MGVAWTIDLPVGGIRMFESRSLPPSLPNGRNFQPANALSTPDRREPPLLPESFDSGEYPASNKSAPPFHFTTSISISRISQRNRR